MKDVMARMTDQEADYLQTRAAAEHKTSSQVVMELVRERIRASA